MAALEVLGFLHLHLVTQPEARAMNCKLCDIDMYVDKGLDSGHAQILSRLMESHPVFRMDQAK